jgi:hypothetical protein
MSAILCVQCYSVYVCIRGGPNQPLHRDPQWSIVLLFCISRGLAIGQPPFQIVSEVTSELEQV